MWIHLIALSVAAEPTFEGNDEIVDLASRMWTAAEGCAGRTALAHATVPVERRRRSRDLMPNVIKHDEQGLASIEYMRDSDPIVLANAIASAWFTAAPLALRTGLGEQLTECIAGAIPDDMARSRRDVRPLAHLEDLRDWGAKDYFEPNQEELLDLLSASWRLGQVLSAVLPPEVIYSPQLTSWEALAEALATVEHGPEVQAMIEGGEDEQQVALLDQDFDGLYAIQEQFLGTDPEQWDTDGDGWWDGYTERPAGAIPVSPDGSAVCLNRVSASGRTPVEVGGTMRGVDLTVITPADFRRVELWRIPSVAVSGRGGHWIRAVADDLVDNPRCQWSPKVTVRVSPSEFDEQTAEEALDGVRRDTGFREVEGVTAADLQGVAAAVSAAVQAFESDLGPMRWRMQVELGPGDATELRNTDRTPLIAVPRRHYLRATRKPENLQGFAYQAVALQRLTGRTAGASHPGTALLMARHRLDRKVPMFVATNGADAATVRLQFKVECEDGWEDVFEGFCLDRIDLEMARQLQREEKKRMKWADK